MIQIISSCVFPAIPASLKDEEGDWAKAKLALAFLSLPGENPYPVSIDPE